MNSKLLFLTFLCFAAGYGLDEAKVDYYERLINEEIQRASTYQPPKDAREYQHRNAQPVEFGSVDFVVIGAGSAGSVAAARLSEVTKWQVLLLEAGQEENDFTRIPSMHSYVAKSKYDWGFQTAPQNTCSLSTGGTQPYIRGKSLGGSSAINILVYTRGNRLDYDNWEAQGNPGWSYRDVLPYFIKSEHALFASQECYHGYGGPLTVEYGQAVSKRMDIFLHANKEIGVPTVDYNGEQQLGASKFQYTMLHGTRMSSARAFLEPVRNRPNLQILTKSYVTKILVSEDTKQAYGVLFSHENVQYIVKVDKEVVLSGGAIGSPQLLMLSGIGPGQHLKLHNIPVIKNLAVGKNFHDHLIFPRTDIFTHQSEPLILLRNAIKQYLNGTGPLTTPTGQGVGFYRLDLKGIGVPDIELAVNFFEGESKFEILKRQNMLNFAMELHGRSSLRSVIETNIFYIYLFLLHPETRGSVLLNSSDPYEFPVINSRCLADPEDKDIERVLKGTDIILRLLDTRAFKKLRPVILPYPACLDHLFLSREYFKCIIRQTALSGLHGAGTCKMGPDPSKGAVVRYDLKIHGIANLRVADASVVPAPLSAHMSAPSMMIGEKAADFIKVEHGVI